ncbi:MAG: hypothetical protein K6T81_21030 [Alicyclobacillus macrosporangiidus]|uniref:hypothetical protein n=1 Tax=Alicyclobacillus macrosporangiidus TaxID=392015 RepID=UPI0026F34721|nr:hypothetical protein [Alicyclobacillus macrosporangiidus]MCL6601192.1 hypothetical protein [Alicyclobacillus macrosporangiidus]
MVLFDLTMTASELQVIAACIDFVKRSCTADEIREYTGCESAEELGYFLDSLRVFVSSEFDSPPDIGTVEFEYTFTYLDSRVVEGVKEYDLRFSESDIEVFEGCLDYVLNVCSDRRIQELTGMTAGVLSQYQQFLRGQITTFVPDKYLPARYSR